jgi:hypothetical protein
LPLDRRAERRLSASIPNGLLLALTGRSSRRRRITWTIQVFCISPYGIASIVTTVRIEMADGGVFVHQAATDAHAQITRLFDFMSPTIVAMWNLRWQVQGFVQAYPDATQQDIVKRFALGSGVRPLIW